MRLLLVDMRRINYEIKVLDSFISYFDYDKCLGTNRGVAGMRTSNYLLIKALFAASIYFGLFKSLDWASNIAYFIAWTYVFVSFFLFSDNIAKKFCNKGKAVPTYISSVFDGAIVLSFAAVGSEVLAAFYLASCLIIYSSYKQFKNKK